MRKRHWPLLIRMVAILASLGLLSMSVGVIWAITLPIPDFESFFQERIISQSTKIYDRTGQILLYDVHSNVKRTVVPFDAIADYAKKAAIAIEDSSFYQHRGIKISAIIRAVIVDISTGQLTQGGSTITQQVIKGTILSKDKTISRKIKEWILALKLEKEMSKDQILALYLNEAPYGGNLYGIETAAKSFFGKSAKNLNLAEAAYLAAIPQAPTYYSPYGDHRDKLDARKNLVLDRMAELGYITNKEVEDNKGVEVVFLPLEERGIKAPHFVFFVKSYLEEKYGKEMVEEGGLIVITTLDWEKQRLAEEIVRRYGEQNATQFNAKNMGLVAIDPKTGQIIAMVGSKDYFDIENEGNFNITLAKRQPGSAFKPFVYAAALEKGYTPETMVFDLKTQFSTNCPPNCYEPENYDGNFVGPISMRNALAQSRNIPAVKFLYLAGLNNSLRIARDFGITSLDSASRYGLTLVLGGGEVSLLELTSAYGTFANDGVRNPYEKILELKDSDGKVLEKFEDRSKRVISENVARQINDILADTKARAPLFGGSVNFTRPVALKTGTTNDYRDAWVVGYTPNLVVGAWAGNNDNSPMQKKIAGLIVVPAWNQFFSNVVSSLVVEGFLPPNPTPTNLKPILRGFWQGNQSYIIDKISGQLATENTPLETKEERVIMNPHSILFWVDKNNPQGLVPYNSNNDPQFPLWEIPVQSWVSQNGIKIESSDIIPTNYDPLHQNKVNIDFNINNPVSLIEGSSINLSITGLSSTYPITQVDYFINDKYIGSSNKSPYLLSFNPSELNLNSGVNIKITVIAYDSIKNKVEKTKDFKIN